MRIWMLISIFTIGCSSEESSKTNFDAGTQKEFHFERSSPNDEISLGDYSCGKFERIELKIDGGTFTVDVPLPCDPLWTLKDRGDPIPKNRKAEPE